jgi:hypothetical protein
MLRQKVETFQCVGPSASELLEWSHCNGKSDCEPRQPTQEKCLEKTLCNYKNCDPNHCKQECEDYPLGMKEFCGLCGGPQCDDMTEIPVCYWRIGEESGDLWDAAECEREGGKVITAKWSPQSPKEICLFNATTKEQCILDKYHQPWEELRYSEQDLGDVFFILSDCCIDEDVISH